MSSHLVPLLFSDWWETLEEPHHLLDQNFGTGLNSSDLLHLLNPAFDNNRRRRYSLFPPPAIYSRPWRSSINQVGGGGTSTVKDIKDRFQVNLDVQQFQPEEVSVKVVGRQVIVEAKHEEKRDEHGLISRHFIRKYIVPDQCDIDQVVSNLSSDGVLTVMVPRQAEVENKNERTIKIERTGKPALVDMNKPEKKEENQGPKEESKPRKK